MTADKKRIFHKIKYYLLITAIFIFGAAALVTGAAIVSVNCHNAMNAESITLFEIENRDGEKVITVMGREYTVEKDNEQ